MRVPSIPLPSVRYGIPGLILLFAVALAAFTVRRDQTAAEAMVRGQAVSQMLGRMMQLQMQFSYAFRGVPGRRPIDDLSVLVGDRGQETALFADETAVVRAATSDGWIGQPVQAVVEPHFASWENEPLSAAVERVRAQALGEVQLAESGRYVFGVFPVDLGPSELAGGMRNVGVLIVRRDLGRDLARAVRAVKQQTAEMLGMVSLLSLLLAVLVHFSVSRRLKALVTASSRVAAGDLEARSGLIGTDEVALVGRSFDRMAERIADAHRQLEHRVQTRTAKLSKAVKELRREAKQRRRTENALRDANERIRVTLASLGDGVITTDLDGRIEYLNPSAEALLGIAADQAVGHPLGRILKLIHETNGVPVDDPLQECLSGLHVSDRLSNTAVIRSDGVEIPIDQSASPIRDRDGRVIGAVLIIRDVTEVRQAARQLSYHASHDALTGLANRREFERRLQEVLNSGTSEESHSVLYLDLDQFKIVNDTCGHAAGDELLRQIGGILEPHIRKRDTLARLGGDEFGVLLEHCPKDRAIAIAGRVRTALQDFRFVWEDRGFTIGASIGLVPVDCAFDSLASVFRAADSACYMAKEQGGNRVHTYQRDDRTFSQRHGEMQWVPRIQAALADDRFELFFQPIVPLGGDEKAHGEVLIRLRNVDGELVMPGSFIPAAERYNQMQAIDRWVVRNAFAALAGSAGVPAHTCLAINLSGQSLGDEQFLSYVEHEIDESGVPLEQVCFEITETAAISNLSHARRFFSALKPRGCLFALDDFGSGLSSFAYLKNLPVDFLKIDGSFVRDMADDPIDHAMVEAIHNIGRVMGIETIAECVENDKILAKLRDIGVNYAQGYATGRPRSLLESQAIGARPMSLVL